MGFDEQHSLRNAQKLEKQAISEFCMFLLRDNNE